MSNIIANIESNNGLLKLDKQSHHIIYELQQYMVFATSTLYQVRVPEKRYAFQAIENRVNTKARPQISFQLDKKTRHYHRRYNSLLLIGQQICLSLRVVHASSAATATKRRTRVG